MVGIVLPKLQKQRTQIYCLLHNTCKIKMQSLLMLRILQTDNIRKAYLTGKEKTGLIRLSLLIYVSSLLKLLLRKFCETLFTTNKVVKKKTRPTENIPIKKFKM